MDEPDDSMILYSPSHAWASSIFHKCGQHIHAQQRGDSCLFARSCANAERLPLKHARKKLVCTHEHARLAQKANHSFNSFDGLVIRSRRMVT